MATYQGSPFEAGIGPTDGDIVLFAACPPPEELGFEPATGHWRKQLRFSEVQAVWESKPIGTFRGERCMVLDDLGDRLHIGYLGHDGYKAEQLGYWQVDRGVFELVAPRTEVSDILEERAEYRRPVSTTDGAGGAALRSRDSAGYPIPARNNSGGYPVPARNDSAGYPVPARNDSAGYPVPARNDSAGYPIPGRNDSAGYPIPGRNDSAGYPIPAAASQSDLPGRRPPPSTDLPDPAGYGNSAAQPTAFHSRRPEESADQFSAADVAAAEAGGMTSTAYRAVPDGISGVALPVAAEAPLPLEAEALRAASAARRPRSAAPLPANPMPESANTGRTETRRRKPALSRQRRAGRRRMATEHLFAELAGLAGIPSDAYAIGEDVEGALCLIQADDKFEVYHSAGGAQHELQVFPTEESACFYLFGVLAAEAVRNGALGRVPTDVHASPAY